MNFTWEADIPVTDRQTDRQTHTHTQNQLLYTLFAHAHRGIRLKLISIWHGTIFSGDLFGREVVAEESVKAFFVWGEG